MRPIVILLCGVLASACATMKYQPRYPDATPQQLQAWQAHQQRIATHQNQWRFLGRFGASTEDDAWSGSIWWQQQQDDYRIQLAGPLQQGTIQLFGNKSESRLQLAESKTYRDGDAESLLLKYTGWTIPFSSLRYWVLGLPQPEGELQWVKLNDDGRIQSINNGFWRVEFQRYRNIDGVDLPKKIVLERSDVKIRLVFDQWEFNDG